jgi:hypothetical protein
MVLSLSTVVLNYRSKTDPNKFESDGQWYWKHSGANGVIVLSAKQGTGVDEVKQWLLDCLHYMLPTTIPRYAAEPCGFIDIHCQWMKIG